MEKGNSAAGQGKGDSMEKHILRQYSDALVRVGILQEAVGRIEDAINKMNVEGYYAVDVVNRGKKGRKSLGNVVVRGFPHMDYDKACRTLEGRLGRLKQEQDELLELTSKIEEYISGIDNIEIRNILTLYYVNNLKWKEVAHRMNEGKKKKYTEDSCRHKHDRFIEKNF